MKKRKILIAIYSAMTMALCSNNSYGQITPSTPEITDEAMFEMDLEQLMNIQIESASKKSESLYDAPFASSVLTKEEIKRSGATTIMEAFKLMPGLIVREQTNGNYDIHIRGLDNVPPNSVFVNSTNSTTLVMIDNRPVCNYLQGGTFWESLPVDLNDVEKIEIVRGPASAMYGPNAASGVINIMTRKIEKDGVYSVANIQGGTSSTAIANASIGYQPNSKFSFILSGNYQNREREKVEYYRVAQHDYVTDPKDLQVSNAVQRYPNPERAMQKSGVNALVKIAPIEKVQFDVTAGMQNSEVQKIYGENLITPISTTTSNSRYADIKGTIFDATMQVSYLTGTQDPTVGFTGSRYDFKTLDGYLEYAIRVGKLTIKPGYNFRKAEYADTKYWDASKKEGIISGSEEIVTNAGSVRMEFKAFKDKLRVFGGARLDKFNYPEKAYFSYQAAATYTINQKNLVRLVFSQAPRSPFIYDNFLNLTQESEAPSPMGPLKINAIVSGSKNLKLVTSRMIEVGYRGKFAKNVQLDVDVFRTVTENYTSLIVGQTDFSAFPNPIPYYVNVKNVPLEVHQIGATVALNSVFDKFQFKPFITIQRTDLKNYSEFNNESISTPTADNPFPNVNNYLNGRDKEHEFTPKAYGGAYMNYSFNSKLNFNLSPYFYYGHSFRYKDALVYANDPQGRGIAQIDPKLVLNARVSYKVIKQLDIFVSGKNITGDTSREYYKSDKVGVNFLGGLNFQL